MNENLEKLLKMAKVTTTQNIEVRNNFIMYKNGDRGFIRLPKSMTSTLTFFGWN